MISVASLPADQFGTPITIHDNPCVAQTTNGTLTPAVIPHSILGVSVPVPGALGLAVPASAGVTPNPIHMPFSLVVVGGTVTAIAVNGVTTGLTAGTFFIDCNDTYTITYSVAPTTFDAVMHG